MTTASKILVVDDDLVTSRMLERMLRRRGFEVFTATRAASVLQMMREHQPRLVLLDVKLPGLEGPQVVKQVRSDPAIADSTIILYSCIEDGALARETKECGADGYIAKSRGILHLERHLERWLRAPAAVRTT